MNNIYDSGLSNKVVINDFDIQKYGFRLINIAPNNIKHDFKIRLVLEQAIEKNVFCQILIENDNFTSILNALPHSNFFLISTSSPVNFVRVYATNLEPISKVTLEIDGPKSGIKPRWKVELEKLPNDMLIENINIVQMLPGDSIINQSKESGEIFIAQDTTRFNLDKEDDKNYIVEGFVAGLSIANLKLAPGEILTTYVNIWVANTMKLTYIKAKNPETPVVELPIVEKTDEQTINQTYSKEDVDTIKNESVQQSGFISKFLKLIGLWS